MKAAPKKESWSDEEDEDDEAAPKAAGKAFEPAPRAAGKKEEPASSSKAEGAKKVAATDPDAVVVTKNSFEDLECNRQAEVDKMCQLVVKKLKSAEAKHAKAKFLHDIIQGMQGKLTLAEAESLHKTSKDLWTKRKKVEDAKAKEKAAEAEAEEEDGKKAELEKQEVDDEDFFASMM